MINNHLKNKVSLNPIQLEKSEVNKYSIIHNINKELISKINFNDKTYINRIDFEEKIINDENFLGLVESIKISGLLNPIYLLENKEGYTIISGLRRSLAIRTILQENDNKIWQKQAVIFRENTPKDLLEAVSLDENTKRKDLSILELSYKFNKLINETGLSMEECLTKFNIAKSQFYAIKKAINFHEFIIKNFLEEIGPINSDYLNKIFLKLIETKGEVEGKEEILLYKDKTREELKEILKKFQEKRCKNTFDFKRTKKKTTIAINKNLSDEDYEKIQEFIKDILEK